MFKIDHANVIKIEDDFFSCLLRMCLSYGSSFITSLTSTFLT
jgi:hypothetical protein